MGRHPRWGGGGRQRATGGFELAETNLGKWRTLGNYAARTIRGARVEEALVDAWPLQPLAGVANR